ncbi:hypothetical protein SMMN14_01467 [Sphaerulina musiva]
MMAPHSPRTAATTNSSAIHNINNNNNNMGIRSTTITTTIGGMTRSPTPESIESLRRRSEAADILESYEKLSWYAAARCETITQTRIHFKCILSGITAAQEQETVFWKEDFTPRPTKPNLQGGSSSSSRKAGKDRVVSDGSASGVVDRREREKCVVVENHSPKPHRKGKEKAVGGGSATM